MPSITYDGTMTEVELLLNLGFSGDMKGNDDRVLFIACRLIMKALLGIKEIIIFNN